MALGIAYVILILFKLDNNIGLLLLLTTMRNILPVAYCCQFKKFYVNWTSSIMRSQWLSRSTLMDL